MRHYTPDAVGLGHSRSSCRKSRLTAKKIDKGSPVPSPPGAHRFGTSIYQLRPDKRRGARFDLPHAVGFELGSGAGATS
jgi:hypothetical protein